MVEADLWFLVLWATFSDCAPHVFVMQIRVIFALPSLFGAPSLGALSSCSSRLPLDPPLVGGKRKRAECHLHKVGGQGKRKRSEY